MHCSFTGHMGWVELLGDEEEKRKTLKSSNSCDFPSEQFPTLEISCLSFAAVGQRGPCRKKKKMCTHRQN